MQEDQKNHLSKLSRASRGLTLHQLRSDLWNKWEEYPSEKVGLALKYLNREMPRLAEAREVLNDFEYDLYLQAVETTAGMLNFLAEKK